MKECKYYLWGTGEFASMISSLYQNELQRINFVGYIDNDKTKWGKIFYGKEIYAPEILRTEEVKYILIVNQYGAEICHQLETDFKDCNCYVLDEMELTRLKMLNRYENSKDLEIQEIVSYLETHSLTPFNYSFVENYNENDFLVDYDKQKKLYYVMHEGKKMFFSRSLNTEEKVRRYYKSIIIEQDKKSPHLYLTDTFLVPENAVIIDAGVAEGNFSLSVIEKAKMVYLFEPDTLWAEALRYTFEPYKEKVVIIEKYLSNYVCGNVTTIDNELRGAYVDFIKMDIEGEEYYALEGAAQTICQSAGMQCAICTYHKEHTFEAVAELLKQSSFELETSKGYMWYPEGTTFFRSSILRHGLIRASKVIC